MPTIKIPYLLRGLYGKTTMFVSSAEFSACKTLATKESILIGEAWHRRYGKGKQQAPESTPKSMHDVKPSEKAMYNKILRGFPDDCPDMFSIEGAPNLRQCVCPMRERPVDLPQKNGIFIVDNPKICWRCRGLGNRKVKKQPEPKRKSYREKPKRQSYREAKVDWGNSEGVSAFDLPS